jgi:hypothetical protein
VVRDGVPLAVTEAARDERVPQELVERYGIGAYLGVPLVVAGQTLGSLCVIDVRPREFTSVQLQALAAIGERARADSEQPGPARTQRPAKTPAFARRATSDAARPTRWPGSTAGRRGPARRHVAVRRGAGAETRRRPAIDGKLADAEVADSSATSCWHCSGICRRGRTGSRRW